MPQLGDGGAALNDPGVQQASWADTLKEMDALEKKTSTWTRYGELGGDGRYGGIMSTKPNLDGSVTIQVHYTQNDGEFAQGIGVRTVITPQSSELQWRRMLLDEVNGWNTLDAYQGEVHALETTRTVLL